MAMNLYVNAAVQGWPHIHVCRTAIYMYIRGRFVANLEMRKKGDKFSRTVTMSMSPLPGNPVPPRLWCSTPLSRREEQAEPAVLPGP